MTTHGTASVDGIYVEFQAAVLRALPRNIDPNVALGWTKNGESLARTLRGVLLPSDERCAFQSSTAETYPVTVDYDFLIGEAVTGGKYERVDPDFSTSDLWTWRKGTANILIELLHFNRAVSASQAFSELDKMGCRPVEIHELLAFGKKYPEIQLEFPVVALGSVLRRSEGYCAPYLGDISSKRVLGVNGVTGFWTFNETCRFAAVRK